MQKPNNLNEEVEENTHYFMKTPSSSLEDVDPFLMDSFNNIIWIFKAKLLEKLSVLIKTPFEQKLRDQIEKKDYE